MRWHCDRAARLGWLKEPRSRRRTRCSLVGTCHRHLDQRAYVSMKTRNTRMKHAYFTTTNVKHLRPSIAFQRKPRAPCRQLHPLLRVAPHMDSKCTTKAQAVATSVHPTLSGRTSTCSKINSLYHRSRERLQLQWCIMAAHGAYASCPARRYACHDMALCESRCKLCACGGLAA